MVELSLKHLSGPPGQAQSLKPMGIWPGEGLSKGFRIWPVLPCPGSRPGSLLTLDLEGLGQSSRMV